MAMSSLHCHLRLRLHRCRQTHSAPIDRNARLGTRLAGSGYQVAEGWLEPDGSVSWPDQRRDEKYFVGSPMVAVGILSPGEDWAEKLELYIADGAKEVSSITRRKRCGPS